MPLMSRATLLSLGAAVLVSLLGQHVVTMTAAAATLPSAENAAARPWVTRHFTTADGLPVAGMSAVRMDRLGFIWLATFDGLVRFDGMRFAVHDQAASTDMPSNRIVDLMADSSGLLHALTRQGDLIRIDSPHITRIRPDRNNAQSRVLELDEANACVTMTSGYFCMDVHGEFQPRAVFAQDSGIRHVLAGSAGSLWLLAPGRGLWLQAADKSRRLLTTQVIATPARRNQIMALTDGSVILTGVDEIIRVQADGHTESLLPADYSIQQYGDILSLRQGVATDYWVITSRGIYRLDVDAAALHPLIADMPTGPARFWSLADGANWFRIGNHLYRDGTLVLEAEGRIDDLLMDANGAVWVATASDGLFALTRPRVLTLDRAAGLAVENLYSVDHDARGVLWTGSLGGGIQSIDVRQAGAARVQQYVPGGIHSYSWLVAVGPHNEVLAALFDGGLLQRLPDAQGFAPLALPDALNASSQRVLYFDQDDKLWLGGTAGAWRRDAGAWQRYWPASDVEHSVTAILSTGAKEHWFGTMRGLWHEVDGRTVMVAPDALGEAQIRSIYQDSNQIIWICTQGLGLFRIQHDAGAYDIQRLTRANGLPGNSPHAMVEDPAGRLWVNSNRGIYAVLPDDLDDYLAQRVKRLTPLLVTPADGVRQMEGNGGVQPSSSVDASGRIWFPTQGGLLGLQPAEFNPHTAPPLAVVDGIQFAQQRIVSSGSLTLPLGVRAANISFAAADLYGGTVQRFRYALLPDTPAWSDIYNQNSVSLAGLRPGDYRFRVIAADSQGRWSEQAAELAFSIPPYWYETRRFHGLLGLLLMLSMLWWVHARTRAERQRSVLLDRQVKQRTSELAAEQQRLQDTLAQLAQAHQSLAASHTTIACRNRRLAEQTERLERLDGFRKRLLADVSHELRTPLMLIEMPLEHLASQMDSGSTSLNAHHTQEIAVARQQAERLHGLLAQLITLVEAESGQLELSIKRFDIVTLLQQLRDSYASLAAPHEIRLELSTAQPPVLVYADRQHLETAIGNLVMNAIKHAPDGGKVTISLRVDSDRECLRIDVSDDGPGFDASTGRTLFERFCRGENQPLRARAGLGIGLALAREISELHGGAIGAISAPGEGATFWIELPLGSSHVAIEELALHIDHALEQTPVLPQTPAAHTECLVLVEDHPELATYLNDRLSEWLPVKLFQNAESALAALPELTVGLLVSDVVLPAMSGIELCRSIRADERLQTIPVLLISARATVPDQRAGLDAGADNYLIKPFSFEQLLVSIRSLWPAGGKRLQVMGNTVEHDPLLQAARRHLNDPDFDIASWADLVHLSPRQLRRRISDATRMPPTAWLREQRLLQVRTLLESGTCKTLVEAGERCGLDNPAYLYRLYRARFGRG